MLSACRRTSCADQRSKCWSIARRSFSRNRGRTSAAKLGGVVDTSDPLSARAEVPAAGRFVLIDQNKHRPERASTRTSIDQNEHRPARLAQHSDGEAQPDAVAMVALRVV